MGENRNVPLSMDQRKTNAMGTFLSLCYADGWLVVLLVGCVLQSEGCRSRGYVGRLMRWRVTGA